MLEPIILLVDDNKIQAETRRAILSRVGGEVIVAGSAVAALGMLEDPRLCSGLGVLVTDHLMPGMNGPELVDRVRKTLPLLPILVLSGLPDAESEYPAGQVVFRLKPYPPGELIRLVKHMLGARGRLSA